MSGRGPRFEIRWATPEDDEALRGVLNATPMPGAISLRFGRDPCYFHALITLGHTARTLIAWDHGGNRAAGCADISVRDVYLDGEKTTLGYLSNLRILPEYRRYGLLRPGVRFVKNALKEMGIGLFMLVVAEGNSAAERILLSGRGGLPPVIKLGTVIMRSLIVAKRCARLTPPVEPCTDSDLVELRTFIERHRRREQLSPAWDPVAPGDDHRAASPDEYLVYREDGRIAGCIAGWDHRGLKQHTIHAYRGVMAWGRHLYNLNAWLRGLPALLPVGTKVDEWFAWALCVEDNRADICTHLLNGALRAAARKGIALLHCALDATHPLAKTVARLPKVDYPSGIYLASWQTDLLTPPHEQFPLQPEMATW